MVLGSAVRDNPEQRYIRQSESSDVFVTEFIDLPSTNDEWVDNALFPESINDVVEVVIDRYACERRKRYR